MEGSYFPEDKDLAHKIMMELSNSDLVKVCATNKRMYAVCNNYPAFWRNKFIKDYGEHAAEYKPEDRSWKTHYLRVFIDLQKYKNKPDTFLFNIFWKDDVDNSYFIDYENQTYVPLKDAPEWVMSNLYLLNIGQIKLYLDSGLKEYKNIKPIEIFQIFQKEHRDSAFKYLKLDKHSRSNVWTSSWSTSLSIYLDSTLPGPRPNDDAR